MNGFRKICLLIISLGCTAFCSAQRLYFSGGYSYSVFLCNTKTIMSWGDNYYGQLARTTSEGSYILPSTIPNITNIISIDAGLGSFCCALTSEGYVLSWGHNFAGELGIGADCPGICKTNEPDTVLGGETGTKYLENVTAISVGQMHVYALLESGEVVSWGNNTYGQIGDGTLVSKNTPTYVKANAYEHLSNIKMIAAGGNHGYALTEAGYVYAWGDNQANQLGCGNSETQVYPQYILDKNSNKISNIESIDGGMFFGIMLRSNSMIYGIGAYKGTHLDASGSHYKTNSYAELVTGGETPNYYLENVTAISAGFSHAMAITKENGINYVVSWGDNRFDDLFQSTGGQLGNGNASTDQYYTPIYMKLANKEKITNAVNINAGCGVSYVETFNENTGTNIFYVCGSNEDGQLGLGDYLDRYSLTPLQNICTPYCGSFSFNPNKTLCTPIDYILETPFYTNSFSFEWYENDSLLSNTTESLNIYNKGTYKVKIFDKSGDCPDIESEIYITEKEKDFHILNTSFCNSEITFKVVGDGNFHWYGQNNGYELGTGNVITVSKYFATEIVTDSLYQVWVEQENGCQPIPVKSLKNCECNITAPQTSDAEFCYNLPNFLTANGDSIVWYADNLQKNPITLNDTLQTNYEDEGLYILYASQIKNGCESSNSTATLNLYFCEPWYYLSGTVENDFGELIKNTTVYLYCDDSSIPVDSCITDSLGVFSLITHECFGKILVKTPSNYYIDTWAGNQQLKKYAYEFYVDATIKHITITLLPISNEIENICPSTIWSSGQNAYIYSLSGKLINVLSITTSNFNTLQEYKTPVIVKILDKNKMQLLCFILNK